MDTIINKTPHPVTIRVGERDIVVEPTAPPARIEYERVDAGTLEVDGVQVGLESVRPAQVTGLPDCAAGTWFVVARPVADYLRRGDLLVPEHVVRDVDGRVVACQGFAVIR